MDTGVYTKISTEMLTKIEDFCLKRVLTGNFPVLMKMYTKVGSVNFHMSYFHMFMPLTPLGGPEENIEIFRLGVFHGHFWL